MKVMNCGGVYKVHDLDLIVPIIIHNIIIFPISLILNNVEDVNVLLTLNVTNFGFRLTTFVVLEYMCLHPTIKPYIHKVHTIQIYNLVARAPIEILIYKVYNMEEVLLHLVMYKSIRCYTFMYASVTLNYNKVCASYPNGIGLKLLSSTNSK